METTNQASFNPFTVLKDRVLWFDGDSSYSVKGLVDKMLSGDDDWINNYIIDPDEFSVKRFNALSNEEQLKNKTELHLGDDAFEWNIPKIYKNISVESVIMNRLNEEIRGMNAEDASERRDRVRMEMELWEGRGLYNLLKTLMFITDTLIENNIIWGTGRGSSCCSYVLYLIGVHDVDSVHYKLDIKDFFRA